jgi:transposase
MIIKSTAFTTKFANPDKQTRLGEFLHDYRDAVEFYVDHVWSKLGKTFETDKFISTKSIYPANTNLSQRALKCAATQACAMVRAATEKRRRQLFVLKKLMRGQANTKYLQRKIDTTPVIKPTVPKHLGAELNSICAQLHLSVNSFDNWLILSSLGKKYGKILIPIKQTRHSRKLQSTGTSMSSFLVSTTTINCRYEIANPDKRSNGKVLGADQGVTTCLSLSDHQVTNKCLHGHDLHSISKKLAGCKRGSKGFRRAQAHRTNYINWSINQLDLCDVKEIKLEKLYKMRCGQSTSRFLSHFSYKQIHDKLLDRCLLSGITFTEQSNVYRSQRCSDCGFVHRSNRKGKEFICRHCGVIHDADINSALNHQAELMELPVGLRHLKLNRTGFFWNQPGIFDLNGQEITVPVNSKQ